MEKLTLSLREACQICREHGFPLDTRRMRDGIISGRYPFGKQIGEGPTGRATFEIFRCDLMAWLAEKGGN